MLWMGSFHQNVTQQKAGKNPSLRQALVSDQLSALPGVTGPFPGLVTFEQLLKALDHRVSMVWRDVQFSLKKSEFLTLTVEEAQLIT